MKIRDVELINMGFESAKKRSNFGGNACEIFPQGVWAASTYVVYQYDDIIGILKFFRSSGDFNLLFRLYLSMTSPQFRRFGAFQLGQVGNSEYC